MSVYDYDPEESYRRWSLLFNMTEYTRNTSSFRSHVDREAATSSSGTSVDYLSSLLGATSTNERLSGDEAYRLRERAIFEHTPPLAHIPNRRITQPEGFTYSMQHQGIYVPSEYTTPIVQTGLAGRNCKHSGKSDLRRCESSIHGDIHAQDRCLNSCWDCVEKWVRETAEQWGAGTVCRKMPICVDCLERRKQTAFERAGDESAKWILRENFCLCQGTLSKAWLCKFDRWVAQGLIDEQVDHSHSVLASRGQLDKCGDCLMAQPDVDTFIAYRCLGCLDIVVRDARFWAELKRREVEADDNMDTTW